MNWEQILDWFMGLGEPYGVNPVIFGSIYVGAVPFFWLAIAWLVHNLRKRKPIAGPVLMMSGCAISAYVYLIVVGQNVPLWVYVFIVAIIAYALYVTWKKVKVKKEEVLREEGL